MIYLYVGAISYLPFLNFGSAASIFTGVDEGSYIVSLPSPLKFGGNTYSTAYVSISMHKLLRSMSIQINSNGLISLGAHFYAWWLYYYYFPISSNYKVIATYFFDVDLRYKGQVNITLVTKQSNDPIGSIALVNTFLASNISVSFSADWILVAQWMDVCPYGNSRCTNVSL